MGFHEMSWLDTNNSLEFRNIMLRLLRPMPIVVLVVCLEQLPFDTFECIPFSS